LLLKDLENGGVGGGHGGNSNELPHFNDFIDVVFRYSFYEFCIYAVPLFAPFYYH